MHYKLSNLFGEPVAIVAAIQAVMVMALSFGWLDFIGLHSQADIAVVMVALNALAAAYLAFQTHATLLAPVIELFKAFISLGVIYGLHITTEQTGTLIVVITAFFAIQHRKAVIPLDQGSFAIGPPEKPVAPPTVA